MKIKLLLGLSVLLLGTSVAFAQGGGFMDKFGPNYIAEEYQENSDMLHRKPIPVQGVREADVMWSRVIWQTVDLREKMNLRLYYPFNKNFDGRVNLANLVLQGVETGEITAYKTAQAKEFSTEMTYEELEKVFGVQFREEKVTDPVTGESRTERVKDDIPVHEVKRIMLKEVWFFDKRESRLRVNVIGFCLLQSYKQPNTDIESEREVCWIYYPEARNLFSRTPVYNLNNDISTASFDDIFLNHQFSSNIIKESNVYNNREILDYLSGDRARAESEKIKNEIHNFEQDLWEY